MSSASDFIIENGVLKKYKGPGGDVIIPDGVTSIGSLAFYGCVSLTSVTIPDSVTSIGKEAFSLCDRLAAIQTPASVTDIGRYAFCGCSALEAVTLSDGLEILRGGAFQDCVNLKNIFLPASVWGMEWNPFARCSRLAEIEIDPANPYFVLDEGIVLTRDKNRIVACPTGWSENPDVPESVKLISAYAFSGCAGLTSLTIPEGVTEIGEYAFSQCRNLAELTLPQSLKTINAGAFADCGILNTVTVSDGLQKVGGFGDNCFQASDIHAVRVKQWSSIVTTLFRGCGVERVFTDDFSLLPAKYRLPYVLGLLSEKPGTLHEEGWKHVLNYLSKNARKLCPDVLKYPELLAFFCEKKLIKAIDLEAYLSEAEKHGGAEHKALLLNYQNSLGGKAVMQAREEREKIQEGYTDALVAREADRDPEKGIGGLNFVTVGKLSDVWLYRDDLKKYLSSYGAKLGTSVTRKTDWLVTGVMDAPSDKLLKAQELGVRIISEEDFNDMIGKRYKDAPHITVPAWIRSIPARAFEGCGSLKNVTIPDSVESIDSTAFRGCVAMVDGKGMIIVKNTLHVYVGPGGDVVIPDGVTAIGNEAFHRRDNVTSLIIPESVVTIGNNAFQNCSGLTSVTIPQSVTSIGGSVFSGCSGLTSVTIPDSVQSIGKCVFCGCSSLTSVKIPESVTVIGYWTFRDCSNLICVTIPASVMDIDYSAFYNCPNLTIHAPAGSYAEQYAKENNIPFEAE